MKKPVIMRNVMFPLWFLLIFPITWIMVLPANFIIDSAVLLLAMNSLKIPDKKSVWKKAIFKIWIFGFLSDIAGCAILLVTQLIYGEGPFFKWWNENITMPVASNPFETVYGFAFVAVAIALAGVLIYLCNRHFCYKNCDLTPKQIKSISLWMAIVTAPYVVLIPTSWIM